MNVDNINNNSLNSKDFIKYIKFLINNSNDYSDIERKLLNFEDKNVEFIVNF